MAFQPGFHKPFDGLYIFLRVPLCVHNTQQTVQNENEDCRGVFIILHLDAPLFYLAREHVLQTVDKLVSASSMLADLIDLAVQ